MRRSTKKYISSAAGIGAVALGLPMVATAPAHATEERCKNVQIEYRLDGGEWTTNGRMDGKLVTKIEVRLKTEVKNSCQYAVSLASYSAEGPTWATSGKQAFLGWDTTKLSKEKKQATLDVTKYAPKCFGQVDLYGNGKKYDGVDNPLPLYPDGKFPKDLITAWNGGEKCETPPTTPPATTPPATTKPPTSTPTTSTPTTSKPATSTPSSTPSSSTPPATTPVPTTPGDTAPPVGKPEVPPVTETAPPALAETGGDSNAPVMIGVSAGVLLAGGAGVLFWNRRRNSGGTTA